VKIICTFIFLLLNSYVFASEQTAGAYQYTTPKPFEFLTTAPKNYGDVFENSFNKNNLKGLALIAGSTGALYFFDQKIFNEAQRFGRRIGLDNNNHTKEAIFLGDEGLMYVPRDLSSSIIFLGDGWTTLGLSAGFLTAGLINDKPKEKMVASEIAQGLLFSGVSSQTLKLLSGREVPNARTRDRGSFHPFTNPADFHDNKAHYDSFPSAHMTTFMTTFTIIAENYEDVTWIRPVGYSLMTLLAFQLVNTGSHWASDFPLAIGIGHITGKTIVQNGRKPAPTSSQIQVTPLVMRNALSGAQFMMTF
jgi:hypothetical protein